MVTLDELVQELKFLRKGRALFTSDIEERVGPALREVCAVGDADPPAVIRYKVTDRLEQLAGDLPADLRVAVLAAFAVSPEARFPLLQDRVKWAAALLSRDPRTVRRRVDDGIDHLAQLATVTSGGSTSINHTVTAETGWHTTELWLVVALDRPSPETIERRRIVSDQDGLTELDLTTILAVPPEQARLDALVLYGGTLANHGEESLLRRSFTVALPQPLAPGEQHDVAVQFRLSDRQAMRPYFVCVPRRRCALFDLRVRFDLTQPPDRIRRLDGASEEEDLDGPLRGGEALTADPAGEIHVTFRDLTPGLAYGARWD